MNEGTILVTGGAGFIGSHLVDRLVADGRDVRVLDAIEPQVHGDGPGQRNDAATYVEASVLDTDAVVAALDGVTHVAHLAAQVGVGQSMYEISKFVRDNCLGTANLLETIHEHGSDVHSLVVASSMSLYGEGRYVCPSCGRVDDHVGLRELEAMQAHRWEPVCPDCGHDLAPAPTPESVPLHPDSVYATTKRDQEELCLAYGKAYGVRTVALRFFNCYGPRQSLSNPYTGVAAIFSSRLLNGQRPLVFEDGLQARDFVNVLDVARAVDLALWADEVDNVALNVGTGEATTVLDVAESLARHLDVDLEAEVTNRFRLGDIRHCIGDITRARDLLGYEPSIDFDTGMQQLVRWIREDEPEAVDAVATASAELESRGLVL